MQKSQKIKIILLIVIIVLMLISILFLIFCIQNQYRNDIYNYSNKILTIISEKYPEKEEQIIKDIFSNKNKKSENILEKYGIDKTNLEDLPNLGESNKYYLIGILAVVIFGITGIISVFIYYQNKQNKEIKNLDKYCKDIIKGNGLLELKNQEEGLDGILKNDIYDMTMMLKEKNKTLQENNLKTEKLIADISHQLKTPLTSLNLINDLLYTNLPEEKKRKFLDTSAKELEKINWLIKTLLNIAKLDSRTIKLMCKNHNAKEMLESVKKNFNTMCEIHNAKIFLTVNDKDKIYCDEKWTAEAISNILKNAIEHNGKNIEIRVEENQLYTQFIIQDDGEGISKNDIGHIFERFYKAENSKSESLGLGLAFCRSIIENQQGEIKVESNKQKNQENNWTRFKIKLYKKIL